MSESIGPRSAPGFEHVAQFGSVKDEYAAIRDGAALVDRSARMRMHFAGAKPAETLTGLVTCDVLALGPGSGQFGAALTAKGKVIADVRIVARADAFLVETSEAAGPGFAAMIRKYVNPRLSKYADVSGVLRSVGVYGPRSTSVIAAALGAEEHALHAIAPLHLLRADFDSAFVDVVRSPDLG